MKFTPWNLGLRAFATTLRPAPAPGARRVDPSKLKLGKGVFQLRTQGMLDYLVGTLRKTW